MAFFYLSSPQTLDHLFRKISRIVARCSHASPRRLQMFSRQTGSALSKMSSCVGSQRVFPRAHRLRISRLFEGTRRLKMVVRRVPAECAAVFLRLHGGILDFLSGLDMPVRFRLEL